MARRPTQGEVARVAGTSTAVVSYVLNNGPRPVSAETRRKVLAAIEETGYRPNNLARALAFGQSSVVGLVVPDLANPFLAQLVRCLEREFHLRGYSLLIGDSEDSADTEVGVLETLMSQQVAALLWYGVEQPLPLDIVESSHSPVVLLNMPPNSDDLTGHDHLIAVDTDERQHARMATEHLLDHGRTRIAHLGGPTGRLNARERARGWSEALREAGVPAERHLTAPFTRGGGFGAAGDLVEMGSDAVVVSNEMQAVGLLAALAARGVHVPDDIAVVALNGTPAARYTVPSLTAVHLSMAKLSRDVADALSPGAEARAIRTEAELVRRASCGCEEQEQEQDQESWEQL